MPFDGFGGGRWRVVIDPSHHLLKIANVDKPTYRDIQAIFGKKRKRFPEGKWIDKVKKTKRKKTNLSRRRRSSIQMGMLRSWKISIQAPEWEFPYVTI